MSDASTGINCNWCGRFIRLSDLESGAAYHTMITPDSHVSREEWESCCASCNAKNKQAKELPHAQAR